jgi:hypothetical protein
MEYSFKFNGVLLHSLKIFTEGESGKKYSLTCTAPPRWFRGYKRLFERVSDTLRTFPPAESYTPFKFEENRYIDNKEKFSIAPPKGWTVQQGASPGVLVRFVGQSVAGFRSEINIVCDRNKAPLTAYVEAVKDAMQKTVPGLRINSTTPCRIAELPSYCIDFLLSSRGQDLHNLKFIIAAPGRKFIVNCGAREADFAKQKRLFDDCLRSFDLR